MPCCAAAGRKLGQYYSRYWQKRGESSVKVLAGRIGRSASLLSEYLRRDTRSLSLAAFQHQIKWKPNNFSFPEKSGQLHVIKLMAAKSGSHSWAHETSKLYILQFLCYWASLSFLLHCPKPKCNFATASSPSHLTAGWGSCRLGPELNDLS